MNRLAINSTPVAATYSWLAIIRQVHLLVERQIIDRNCRLYILHARDCSNDGMINFLVEQSQERMDCAHKLMERHNRRRGTLRLLNIQVSTYVSQL